jgi:hypothetical protein
MNTFDFIFMDFPEWTTEFREIMEDIQNKTDILKNPIIKYSNEDEYPKSK